MHVVDAKKVPAVGVYIFPVSCEPALGASAPGPRGGARSAQGTGLRRPVRQPELVDGPRVREVKMAVGVDHLAVIAGIEGQVEGVDLVSVGHERIEGCVHVDLVRG